MQGIDEIVATVDGGEPRRRDVECIEERLFLEPVLSRFQGGATRPDRAVFTDGIYRINTPVEIKGAGGFSFNQYLIADDEPLLFHTGPRKMFSLVSEAVASVVHIRP